MNRIVLHALNFCGETHSFLQPCKLLSSVKCHKGIKTEITLDFFASNRKTNGMLA